MLLNDYLLEHNILSPYQCGVRKQHPTKFAALSLADTIRRNIDQGQMTGAVFINFHKAFDIEYEWFTIYLSNRTQVVGFQGSF